MFCIPSFFLIILALHSSALPPPFDIYPSKNDVDILGSPGPTCQCAETEDYLLGATCGGEPYIQFMSTVEQYIRSQCDIVDPLRCQTCDDQNEEFDFIVVGAGAGGSAVAARLSEVPEWKVLLLEAGGPAPTYMMLPSTFYNWMGTSIDWNYPTEPEPNACLNKGTCSYPRGKVMGGTTVLNAMIYMRGHKHDYETLTKLGLKGWDYETVLKYYKKSEDNLNIGTPYADEEYHSTGGPLTVSIFNEQPDIINDFLNAAEQLGYPIRVDLNGKGEIGFSLCQATVRDGTRLTASRAFLYNILDRPNLTIRTYANVHKVLMNETTKKVTGVQYEKEGRIFDVKAKKEVILSAGTIASPQILLQSGIGPKEHLKSVGIPVILDRPGVGKNLQNHVSYDVFYRIVEDTNNGSKRDEDDGSLHNRMNIESLKEFLLHREGPLTSSGFTQFVGFVKSSYSNEDPDIQFFGIGLLANCSKTGSLNEQGAFEEFISLRPVVAKPRSRGYIELKSPIPGSYPKIKTGQFSDPTDIEILLEGIRIAQKLAKTKAAEGKFVLTDAPVNGCENYEYDSDDYWRCAIKRNGNAENHQTGTCAMGTENNGNAVVDNKLRVIGVKRLRVADASIYPEQPSGNTQAPAYLAGERCADFIKSKWLNNEGDDSIENIDDEGTESWADYFSSKWKNVKNYFKEKLSK